MSPIILPSSPAPPPQAIPLEDLHVGRLALPTVTDPITELLGSNLNVVGDATAVGQRRAKGFTLNLVVAGWSQPDPTAAGNRMRRQLRSLVQNAALRLAGIYLQFAFDTERNGWFVIGAAELSDSDGGVTFGSYKLSISEIYRIAGIPTHREGLRVDLTDMRLPYSPIDYLGQVINTTTDFAALTPLALCAVPAGASDLAVLDAPVPSGQRPALGGACPICAGRSNGDVISFEREESDFNLGDVVLYDRRGQLGPFGVAAYDAPPTNLVPNPSFEEGGLVNWLATGSGSGNDVADGATLSIAGAAGSESMMQVATTAVVAFVGQGAKCPVAVAPSTQYTLSCYLTGLLGGETVELVAIDASPGGTLTAQAATATLTTAPQRLSITGTTGLGASVVYLVIRTTGTPFGAAYSFAADTFFADRVQATQTAAAAAYADGDVPGNLWAGAGGNSITIADPQAAYGWEEIYGPDYPYSWLDGTYDVPVLHNGLCRVRYDATPVAAFGAAPLPRFHVDVWTGSAWVVQGAVYCMRSAASQLPVSARVQEYTPERAVVEVVCQTTGDPYSRERTIITLQRGWTGPRFELYLAPLASGAGADGVIEYQPASVDVNDSVVKIDAAGAAILATAGSGSGLFTPGGVGAAGFTGENDAAVLRQPAGYQVSLAVRKAASSLAVEQSPDPTLNAVKVSSSGGAGYVSVHVGFSAQASDQINEAEAIRNAGSSTATQVADATASGGQCVKDTQAASTAPTLNKPVTNLLAAKYRVLARIKVDAGVTGTFQAFIGGVGVTVASTATAWTWLDMGDILATAATANFAMVNWRSAGASGAVYVDRAELILMEDRTQAAPTYSGARDLGQSVLYEQIVELRRPERA